MKFSNQKPSPFMVATVGFSVFLLNLATAHADSCIWSGKEVGMSKDKRFVVTAKFDQANNQWNAVWHDTKTDKNSSAVLKGIERHAHLTVLVPSDGRTFVVLDPSAGHRATDRIQIYYRDGTLIKSYGLKDLLSEGELSKVGHSVSHIQWIGYDKPNKRWHWLNEDGSALEFLTMAGRKVQIKLANLMPETPSSK
jgi:hypothetical protein